jgi:AbrB family looped-hinge helix DNA binding protein
METALDKFGRVVIPKEIRDTLGLAPGSLLSVEESETRVILTPLTENNHLRVKERVLVYTGKATGDISGSLARHRRERIGRLARGAKA